MSSVTSTSCSTRDPLKHVKEVCPVFKQLDCLNETDVAQDVAARFSKIILKSVKEKGIVPPSQLPFYLGSSDSKKSSLMSAFWINGGNVSDDAPKREESSRLLGFRGVGSLRRPAHPEDLARALMEDPYGGVQNIAIERKTVTPVPRSEWASIMKERIEHAAVFICADTLTDGRVPFSSDRVALEGRFDEGCPPESIKAVIVSSQVADLAREVFGDIEVIEVDMCPETRAVEITREVALSFLRNVNSSQLTVKQIEVEVPNFEQGIKSYWAEHRDVQKWLLHTTRLYTPSEIAQTVTELGRSLNSTLVGNAVLTFTTDNGAVISEQITLRNVDEILASKRPFIQALEQSAMGSGMPDPIATYSPASLVREDSSSVEQSK